MVVGTIMGGAERGLPYYPVLADVCWRRSCRRAAALAGKAFWEELPPSKRRGQVAMLPPCLICFETGLIFVILFFYIFVSLVLHGSQGSINGPSLCCIILTTTLRGRAKPKENDRPQNTQRAS